MRIEYLDGSSIYDYINRAALYRNELKEVILSIQNDLPETVVFGGMVRDFELGNARGFKSDIDLVSDVGSKELYQAIKKYDPYKNKFGGYRFNSGKWIFDIWPLSKTWAFKEGLVEEDGFEGLLKTTFFNMDAAFLQIGKDKICASASFKKGMEQRILDLNLRTNPSPKGMAKRALKLAMQHNLSISHELSLYILMQNRSSNLSIAEVNVLKRMEKHVSKTDKPFCIYQQKKLF